jgi:hypothetical protein
MFFSFTYCKKPKNQLTIANFLYNLAFPSPPGQLNPLNDRVYEILGDLFSDLLEAFNSTDVPVHAFHMGGDEVNFPCWASNPDVRKWLAEKGFQANPGTAGIKFNIYIYQNLAKTISKSCINHIKILHKIYQNLSNKSCLYPMKILLMNLAKIL